MSKGSSPKNKVFSSFFWKISERTLSRFVSLAVSIVLARLLTPDDYSVVGIVSIFFAFASIFISGSFNTALIQKKDANEDDYSTTFTISFLFATVLYIIVFFTAPFIADAYDKQILVPVFRIMGLTFFINSFKSIVCAKISKSLEFRKFFWSTIVGITISAVLGIVLAFKGFGPWALVVQQMSNSFIDTVILFATTRVKIKLKIVKNSFKYIFNFGWKIVAASFVATIYDEINPLIIGLKFTTSDLSFYTKGKSFPSIINSTFGESFSSVLFPVMSNAQDNKQQLLSYTRRFMQISSFFVFPMMLGFAVVGDKFISIFLTEKWLPAFPYILVFCFVYMFTMIQTGNLQVINALGRSDLVLKMEIIKKSAYLVVTFLFILFAKNPIYLACSCAFNTIVASYINSFPNKKLLGYGLKEQLFDLLHNLIVSVVMAAAVYFIGLLNINTVLLFIIQILSGAIIYILLNYVTKNPSFSYVLDYAKKFLSR